MSTRRWLAVITFVAASSFAPRALAQETRGFALGGFTPSERGSEWFSLDSLDLRGRVRPAFGLVGDWAHDPLVVRNADGSQRVAIVGEQALVHAGGSLVLFDRARLGLSLPLVAYQSGTSGTADGTALDAPSSTVAGDLRVTADVRLFGEYGDVVTVAAGVEAYLPTGSTAAYTSDGSFRAIPRALVAGKVGPFVYAGRLGVELRSSGTYAGSENGSALVLGGAAGIRPIERLLVGPELYGSTVVGSDQGAFRTRNTPLEALLGAHLDVTKELRAGLGAGGGITRGYGAPEFRGLLAFEWVPRPDAPASAPPAREADPPPPTTTVTASAPILVTVPAPPPPDRDGDGIADASDACPDEAGPASDDPARNGCPQAVVSGDRIQIRDAVRFRFGSAELDPAGDFVLEAVRHVLDDHPELRRVRVEGHTDAIGRADYNKTLSDQRAASVRGWLVGHGIAAERLESRGYGSAQPIMTNDTEDGRRMNRRVEFHVISRGGEP